MKYIPHNYQIYAIQYIENHPVAAVLLDMGLGKTSITLTALNNLLFDSFEIHRVLVIAPSGCSDTWPAEADSGITFRPHLLRCSRFRSRAPGGPYETCRHLYY